MNLAPNSIQNSAVSLDPDLKASRILLMSFQHGKELVFLARIMDVDLGQLFDKGAQCLTVFCKGLGLGRMAK